MSRRSSASFAIGLTVAGVGAAPLGAWQAGDHPGEAQPPLPDDLRIPAAPALSPEEERATFRLPAGLSIELVASEPLVRDPVALAFDEHARLWVVEMRGYMPDADGRGEREPVGSIAVLSDRDGDGVMDERATFLDRLVLPRAVAPFAGGALVIAPPQLLFARDTDGDLRADERFVLDVGLDGLDNPEHGVNGLVWTLDGAFALANADWRYVLRPDPSGRGELGAWKLARQPTAGGGQWGICEDLLGTLYFNWNSETLRGDAVPSWMAARNPAHGHAAGANAGVVGDASVAPARMNPGINRGYQAGMLDERWRLARVTAACSPLAIRGGALAGEWLGDVLVCEPAGNLVLCCEIERDLLGRPRGAPVENPDGLDFLTSTDERFRPVALVEAPDGSVLVADMYRGLIQHRLFVTSFLRGQADERGLAAPTGLGRIWRVRGAEGAPTSLPDLAAAGWGGLVAALDHESAWARANAQRLIVEEAPGSAELGAVVAALAALVGSREATWLGRRHALATLAILGRLGRETALAALGDADARVREAAITASTALAAAETTGGEALLARWVELARGGDARERWLVVLALGEVRTPAGLARLAELAALDSSTAELRSAVLSGLAGREDAFLVQVHSAPDWREEREGRAELVRLAARALVREGRTDALEWAVSELAARAATGLAGDWKRAALARGLLAGRPDGPKGEPTWLELAAEPAGAGPLAASPDPLLREVAAALAWPGKAGSERAAVRALTAEESAAFERGRVLYAAVCAGCHQSSGLGEVGKAPRLRGSPWILGEPGALARMLIGGLVGPIEVGADARGDAGDEGQRASFDGEMPAWNATDEEVAAVLSFVRREWGHGADPVGTDVVQEARAASAARGRPWTATELGAR